MTRNLRAIVRELKRVRPRKKMQRHVVDYRVCKLMICGKTIAFAHVERGFTSATFDTDCPGVFTELTFGS